jgi:hypothetical protein
MRLAECDGWLNAKPVRLQVAMRGWRHQHPSNLTSQSPESRYGASTGPRSAHPLGLVLTPIKSPIIAKIFDVRVLYGVSVQWFRPNDFSNHKHSVVTSQTALMCPRASVHDLNFQQITKTTYTLLVCIGFFILPYFLIGIFTGHL